MRDAISESLLPLPLYASDVAQSRDLPSGNARSTYLSTWKGSSEPATATPSGTEAATLSAEHQAAPSWPTHSSRTSESS